ncbi:MAG: ArsA family ATPase, partial [Methanobacteriota archaeon]
MTDGKAEKGRERAERGERTDPSSPSISPHLRSSPGSARVSFVLGKGGVGRTTIASALAVREAAAGVPTALLSLTDLQDLRARLQEEGEGIPGTERLTVIDVRPRELLDDIVRGTVRSRLLSQAILSHPAYEPLVGIAPGLSELALLHRIQRLSEDGFGRIVVDGPATGHGASFLEAPGKAGPILVGPAARRVDEIRAFLSDPARTDVVLVTLAEETPVAETRELARRITDAGIPLDNVVVNKVPPPSIPTAAARDAAAEDDEAAR